MKRIVFSMITLGLLCGTVLNAQQGANQQGAKATDTSPHSLQFVTVEKDVKLEVLDWGGTGRPLLLLAGLGFDAHVFDGFAPKLVPTYHVYGITRRGFGASSTPAPTGDNYSADRLGDDVLAVIDALKLTRPVLVGHSIAGEELSSIGSRFPDKVAGLIYLDAGYAYAYYNASRGDFVIDLDYLQAELGQLSSLVAPRVRRAQVGHLREVSLPQFEKDLQDAQKLLQRAPDSAPAPPDTPAIRAAVAVAKGEKKYEGVKCPVLAIFADPHDIGQQFANDPPAHAAAIADDLASTSAQADAFQAGNPSARVIRLPNANHFVFRSNEADVLQDMNAFIASLP
jgi:non-heme chloroperoxidase